jgi:hypothetical protein
VHRLRGGTCGERRATVGALFGEEEVRPKRPETVRVVEAAFAALVAAAQESGKLLLDEDVAALAESVRWSSPAGAGHRRRGSAG